jgi:hypothetical protein
MVAARGESEVFHVVTNAHEYNYKRGSDPLTHHQRSDNTNGHQGM